MNGHDSQKTKKWQWFCQNIVILYVKTYAIIPWKRIRLPESKSEWNTNEWNGNEVLHFRLSTMASVSASVYSTIQTKNDNETKIQWKCEKLRASGYIERNMPTKYTGDGMNGLINLNSMKMFNGSMLKCFNDELELKDAYSDDKEMDFLIQYAFYCLALTLCRW